ncbi:MAG: hypothetical protein JXR13_04770 [Thalassovita sp.]
MLNLIALSLLGMGLVWGFGSLNVADTDEEPDQDAFPPEDGYERSSPDLLDPMSAITEQEISLSYDPAHGRPDVSISVQGLDALIAFDGEVVARVAQGAGLIALHNVTLVAHQSAAPPEQSPTRPALQYNGPATWQHRPPAPVVRGFDPLQDVLVFYYSTAAPPKLSITALGHDAVLHADGHQSLRLKGLRDQFTLDHVALIPSV